MQTTLSEEERTLMTQGQESEVAPQPATGNAGSPAAMETGGTVSTAPSASLPAPSHLLQLQPRVMSLNFQLLA